jgi:mono/diheme cytochrome c family protein
MMMNSRIVLSLFLALPILLFNVLVSQSRASDGSPDKGKAIFEAKCSPCHTIGGGIRVGPDLKGVTDLRPRNWLVGFISNPEKMFQAGDPIAKSLLTKLGGIKMPDLGLTQQEISDVLSYIGPQQPVSPAKGQITATAAGDSLRGEKLFVGDVPFQNGGPPCMSCHNVSGIPFPGGGVLGPDLAAAYSKFGAATMNSVLASLPFPTMTPIFNQRPLTQPEQSDLEAFFENASTRPRTNMTLKIVLSVFGGFIVLMVLIWWTWHRRLLAVRKSLIQQATGKGGRS